MSELIVDDVTIYTKPKRILLTEEQKLQQPPSPRLIMWIPAYEVRS